MNVSPKQQRQEQRVVPALLASSEAALCADVATLPFAHELQIDVVDGDFVPFVSWPYDPAGRPQDVATVLAVHSIEVDLMTTAPVAAAKQWVAAGAQQLVFHIETLTVTELEQFSHDYPHVTIGVSALNDTAWETLETYLPLATYVQLMGIAVIGAQGQSFDERVLERCQKMQSSYPEMPISIDGSVNAETIIPLQDAGADRFVVGSALLQAADRRTQYQYLESLTHPQEATGNIT